MMWAAILGGLVVAAIETASWLARRRHTKRPAPAPAAPEPRRDNDSGWRVLDPVTGRPGEPSGPPVPWLYRHRRNRWPKGPFGLP